MDVGVVAVVVLGLLLLEVQVLVLVLGELWFVSFGAPKMGIGGGCCGGGGWSSPDEVNGEPEDTLEPVEGR